MARLTRLTSLVATLVTPAHSAYTTVAASWVTVHLARLTGLRNLLLMEPVSDTSGWLPATAAEVDALARALPALSQLRELVIARRGAVAHASVAAAHAALAQLTQLREMSLSGALAAPAPSLPRLFGRLVKLRMGKFVARGDECSQEDYMRLEACCEETPPHGCCAATAEASEEESRLDIDWASEPTEGTTPHAAAMAAVVRASDKLRCLSIASQALSDDGATLLAASLQAAHNLHDVHLPALKSCGEGVIAMATVAASLPLLERFEVEGVHAKDADSDLPEAVWLDVMRALRPCARNSSQLSVERLQRTFVPSKHWEACSDLLASECRKRRRGAD